MIFEKNIEGWDFLELWISPLQLEKLTEEGEIVKNFPKGLDGTRNLNIYIRIKDANDSFEEMI